MSSNFDFLSAYWPDIAQAGASAETYLYSDPNVCIYKLGIIAERITLEIMKYEKLSLDEELTQVDRIKVLRRNGLLPQNIDDMLFSLRKARNSAVHGSLNDGQKAETLLRMTFNLCCWFMEVYGDWGYIALPFSVPDDHSGEVDYYEQIREKDEKIEELLNVISNIKTTASEIDAENRIKKAETASDAIPLSEEEADYLSAEKVRLEISALPVLNYALQQNGIPIVQSVSVVNNTDLDLEDVILKVSSHPVFCYPYEKAIPYVSSHRTLVINDLHLALDGDYLVNLTEKITGFLSFELTKDGQTLYKEDVETAVLAFDEWHGYRYHPEMLSSFVTPNHPEVTKLTTRVARLLESWTGDPSLDGYQSKDVNRVLKQAAAVYAALQEQNIVYSVPPASFEKSGQRVRLCDAMIQQKMGTCLDLSLLFASILEAIGLHPLLILKRGHIFAGLWLEEETFPESVQDDASLITMRTAKGINEIAVVECTSCTAGQAVSFDDAMKVAEQELSGIDSIEYIIDVTRSRLSGILPVPVRIQTEQGWMVDRTNLQEGELTSVPGRVDEVHYGQNNYETPFSKKKLWERKLLDLGLRNSLINLRLSRSLIPILSTSLDDLENALADGEDFSVLARPSESHSAEYSAFDDMHQIRNIAPVIQSEFKNHRLRSALAEGELEKSIKDLYRSAKKAMEENGANTLYLALGLLRWYENPRSMKPRYAPLILIPIEMVRKSASQGYVIRLRDDEPQMNITMLEKLSQDFQITISGLDPLPTDDHGIDTRRVFTVVRKAVMGQKNWDVLESAYLGIFSFSQFVMWNDLRNRSEDLEKNKIVKSLVNGVLSWDAEEMNIGNRVPEEGTFLPMPADASQLYAIEAACQGKSFVLHGPPGTGKSQTITILIANALAQGKTVLFVAEKMAALSVVQKRLESIGIGPFCLELHSNKSKKRDILEQLRAASEVTKMRSADAYALKAERISTMRKELDAYATLLHKKNRCGYSLYELINLYETYREKEFLNGFDDEEFINLTPETIDDLILSLRRLIAAAKAVRHPSGHPLHSVKRTEFSQRLRIDLPPVIDRYRKNLQIGKEVLSDFGRLTERESNTYGQINVNAQLAEEMRIWFEVPQSWAKEESPAILFFQIQEMCDHYQKANSLSDKLRKSWNESYLSLDGAGLLGDYQAANAKWFLPKVLGKRTVGKKVAPFALNAVPIKELEPHLKELADYRREISEAERLFEKYGEKLGHLYNGAETDWGHIYLLCEEARKSATNLQKLTGAEDYRMKKCGNRAQKEAVEKVVSSWKDILHSKSDLYSSLEIQEDESSEWLDCQISLCDSIESNLDDLREWVAWNHEAEEAIQKGLSPIVIAYMKGLSHDSILPSFWKSFSQTMISNIIDSEPELKRFSGALFNEKIEQYKQIDAELSKLTQKEIYCRLAARVPNFTREASQSSELGILQRAIKSNARGLSIRRLFEQIPTMLPRLCPCMLMSPISAAQYLDPKREPFDIVVFDEASQLPTCKAVGALARGRDAIIVGDPKQMPPTSFFSTNISDEDNMDTDDLESILDDCLALNMPQTHLLWHYRSRHESLIAFSNRQFYENRLYTFPSVNERERKVSLIHVDGEFDRGRTRHNLEEAKAIVGELVRRSHDPEDSKYSVGVVTFNIAQQNLIDDLLNEMCAEDRELESWVYEREEPLFIKNLENVQGDERDVVLFSIGYGPDKQGKVSLNFGPLNRGGGWRRLNVAVSRARVEMVVFSTLTPEQIDLSKTSAEGVSALKAFLEYAGGQRLNQYTDSAYSNRIENSSIVNAICSALKESGYDAEQSVGHSRFKVDIGVVDPDNPEDYLLGILLDGNTYEEAKTIRDRELAQVDMLHHLGWSIIRIWSVDWWANSAKEIDRILGCLHKIQEMKKEGTIETIPEKTQSGIVASKSSSSVLNQETSEYSDSDLRVEKGREHDEDWGSSKIEDYKVASLPITPMTPDDFLGYSYRSVIVSKTAAVIDAEAPIGEKLIMRRVIRSCGIARNGGRMQEYMRTVLKAIAKEAVLTKQSGNTIYWRCTDNPDDYCIIRRNGESIKREPADIPVQEASNALCFVLYLQGSMPVEDVAKEAARVMAFSRMGENVVRQFKEAMRYSVVKHFIEEDNGLLKLTREGTAKAKKICGEN